MEKIQMCGFFIQEVILSSVYILETIRILKTSIQPNTRRLMYQLLAINILIILMDLGLLGLEAASLYILETIVKGFLYSVKLKLEFAILSKLVKFVGRSGSEANQARQESLGYIAEDDDEKSLGNRKASSTAFQNQDQTPDFVDLSRVKTDYTHASQQSNPSAARNLKNRQRVDDFDYEIYQLEHADTGLTNNRRANGDIEGYK
jgi:hypothetical protein